jgi:hypothetical protein
MPSAAINPIIERLTETIAPIIERVTETPDSPIERVIGPPASRIERVKPPSPVLLSSNETTPLPFPSIQQINATTIDEPTLVPPLPSPSGRESNISE